MVLAARIKLSTLVCLAMSLCALSAPAPVATPTQSSPSPSPTVPYASNDPNSEVYPQNGDVADPEPIRGPLGATILSRPNTPIELENPSLFAPPTTDHGTM